MELVSSIDDIMMDTREEYLYLFRDNVLIVCQHCKRIREITFGETLTHVVTNRSCILPNNIMVISIIGGYILVYDISRDIDVLLYTITPPFSCTANLTGNHRYFYATSR